MDPLDGPRCPCNRESSDEDVEYSGSGDPHTDESPPVAPLPKKQVQRKKNRRPVKICCVPQCRSKTTYKGWDLVFHAFPKPTDEFLRDGKRVNRLDEWVRLLGIETEVTKKMWVCSKHFAPEDYYMPDHKRYMKRDVIPSLNLPVPPQELHRQKCLHMVWMPARDNIGDAISSRGQVVSSDVTSALAQTRSALQKVMEMKESRPSSDAVCEDGKKEIAEPPSQNQCPVTIKTEDTDICHLGLSKKSPSREDFIVPDHLPHKEDEFTVDENCLLQLFRQCSTCRAPCNVALVADGNEVMVTAMCSNAHQRSWTNVR